MNLGSLEQRTKGMKKQAQELIEQAYNRGYKSGYEEGKGQTWSEEVKKYEIEPDKKNEYIEQGRNEAWAAAQKIMDTCYSKAYKDLNYVFGTCSVLEIMHTCPPSEAIEKLRVCEEKKQEEDSKIHVGDEVYILDATYHSVVTRIFESNGKKHAICITQNGTWYINKIEDLHKTGRHFPEIVEVLQKLKGE